MSSGPKPLTMSVAEREAFLLEEPRNGILSVAEPDGGTVATPVWFGYEPGGLLTMHLNDPSVKLRALRAAGRGSVTVEDPGDTATGRPYRYVSVTGSVVEDRAFDRARDGAELWATVVRYLGEESARRYLQLGGDAYLLGQPPTQEGVRVVRLQPERWFTRDYGKVRERYETMLGIRSAAT